MRKATKSVAKWFGIVAAIGGLEHGYFEILQGNAKPASLMILSMGPPCVPEEVWSGCEPAMTLLPNYLITGILSMVLGLLTLAWSAAFLGRKRGGLVLTLLSLALLLFGGGIFPPLIGIIGGLAGTKIHQPFPNRQAGGSLRNGAKVWPWPLVIFVVWIFGQFGIGEISNDFLLSFMVYSLAIILATLALSAFSAYAYDFLSAQKGAPVSRSSSKTNPPGVEPVKAAK